MRSKGCIFLVMLLCGLVASAADFVGHWKGKVANLPIVFHIANDSIWSATLDSPMQGAMGIKCGKVVVAGDSITINMPALCANFKGVIAQDDKSITGTFTQGMSLPLTLTRTTADAVMYNRPQEPQPPFVYNTQDVTFQNGDITLAGTLTTPFWGTRHKAVVLVSGSGSQNRDEELFGHRPFKVIADFLSRNGYAVLRMDDRGVGGSAGDPSTSTTNDFTTDITQAIQSLRDNELFKNKPIGVIGHSEGGTIAIKAADKSDFIITLAAPALPGDSIILTQTKAILDASGQAANWQTIYPTLRQRYNVVMSNLPESLLKLQLYNDVVKDIPTIYLTEAMKDQIMNEITSMASPWYRNFLRYNPTEDIKKVDITWLALNGEKDLQVICDQNLSMIQELNPKAKTIKFDGLNHLFQECQTGMVQEYATIEQTISPIVLQTILEWLNSITTD